MNTLEARSQRPIAETVMLTKIPSSHTEISNVVFASDGKNMAYSARIGEKFIVVFNGKESEKYDYINSIVISRDGDKFGYIFRNKKESSNEFEDQSYVVINGEKTEHLGDARNLTFSPNGRHVVFKLFKFGDQYESLIIIDGNKFISSYHTPVFSADGNKIAWVSQKYRISDGGSEGDYFEKSDRSRTYLDYYVSILDLKSKKISNFYDHDAFVSISSLTISPDGKKIAFFGTGENGESYIVTNEDKFNFVASYLLPSTYSNAIVTSDMPAHVNGEAIQFSSDNRLAYVAGKTNDNREYLSIDGQKQEGLYFYGIATPLIFSPDGKRIAFGVVGELYKNEGSYIVLDGKKTKSYKGVSMPNFSPDGQRILHLAKDYQTEKVLIIVDGKELKSKFDYDEIYSLPVFTDDNKAIGYGARINDEVWWIKEEI